MKGDVQRLINILANQKIDGIISADWDQVKPELVVNQDNNDIEVRAPHDEVKFCFDKDENFLGIVNWKE